jgi:replicative DNA helicase
MSTNVATSGTWRDRVVPPPPGPDAGPKQPPHNLDAEQALLGAVLYDNAALERIGDSLQPEHFFEPYHQRLYDAIRTVTRKGQLAEPLMLVDRLKTDPSFEELGGLRYLADLVDRAPPIANAPDYARAIMDLSVRRDLIRFGGDVSVLAEQDFDHTGREHIEHAESALYGMAERGRTSRGPRAFGDVLSGAMENIAAAVERDGKLVGISTGLIDLDRKLGGLHGSDLLILAGRPSMGKTALATNIAFHVARRYQFVEDPEQPCGRRTTDGGVVLFFSLEMSGEQLAMRMLAEASGVSSDRLRKGDIRPDEFARVRDAAIELQSIPLHIDDQGALTVDQLLVRARRLKRMAGLDLVVVDYLQLATAPGRKGEGRVQEVTEITMGLKAMAKELGVPVLALSQLSRQVEQREDKRPQLSDLRESGSIEQDADCVMFVYRESYYLARAEPKEGTNEHLAWQADMDNVQGVAELIIGKQRHGPIGTVKLSFDEDTTKFGNLAREARYEGDGGRRPYVDE